MNLLLFVSEKTIQNEIFTLGSHIRIQGSSSQLRCCQIGITYLFNISSLNLQLSWYLVDTLGFYSLIDRLIQQLFIITIKHSLFNHLKGTVHTAVINIVLVLREIRGLIEEADQMYQRGMQKLKWEIRKKAKAGLLIQNGGVLDRKEGEGRCH